MRIAIIEGTEVSNVIVSDQIPENGIECPEYVSVGWTYKDEEFIAPLPVHVEETIDETDSL
jgi:hypothetical protein